MTASYDVMGTGFAVLDRVYTDSEPLFEDLGGSCGNVLASLAMLSRRVAPLLSLGEDDTGAWLLNAFRGAGAETTYIARAPDRASPVLIQWVDTRTGAHRFSSICPRTKARLPAYQSIGLPEVQRAQTALSSCAVFYVDRLSEAVIEAMSTVKRSGGLVVFEPSAIGSRDIFDRAVRLSAVVKVSADRLPALAQGWCLPDGTIAVATHGAAGLEVRQGGQRVWCASHPAPVVRDTCGAGDLVTVGMIHGLLSRRARARRELRLDDVLPGVRAGQRLASENCAFVGARGVFRQRGPAFVKAVLEARVGDEGDPELAP